MKIKVIRILQSVHFWVKHLFNQIHNDDDNGMLIINDTRRVRNQYGSLKLEGRKMQLPQEKYQNGKQKQVDYDQTRYGWVAWLSGCTVWKIFCFWNRAGTRVKKLRYRHRVGTCTTLTTMRNSLKFCTQGPWLRYTLVLTLLEQNDGESGEGHDMPLKMNITLSKDSKSFSTIKARLFISKSSNQNSHHCIKMVRFLQLVIVTTPNECSLDFFF